MVKLPYGISNFETLVSNGYLYVDRTPYIEVLESLNQRYLFFVRPRRFGKSLFLSVLEYYYGLQYKDKFEQLFGKYHIGRHPTASANQYLILKFDFSQLDTSSFENTYQSFLGNVKDSALTFLGLYDGLLGQPDIEKVENYTFPAEVMQHILRITKLKAPNHKIYLLIDEYDHFANEILSFRFGDFQEMVGKNGFVRKFYEAVKVGTQSGTIDRLFITGVSPLTLDSLTSGFNISANISLREEFNALMGFKQHEVREVLRGIGVPQEREEEVLALMKEWYDGYLFAKEAAEQVYNSDMVLYFATEYSLKKQYPEDLLDPNIASDYTKIRRLFKIKGKEKEHLLYLDELLTTGEIRAKLVRQFELERRFDRNDFISLLYYTGIITIHKSSLASVILKMPNYVIEQLYYQYFHQVVLERSRLPANQVDLHELVSVLALDDEIQPLIAYTQDILTALSTRDKMKFDEKYLKAIFTSILFTVGVYTIHHEFEVKQSPTSKGYVDILLQKRPPFETKYQFVMELKYVKKADAARAEEVKKEAVGQLQRYLQHDDYLQRLEHLKAYVLLFVGNEGEFVKVSV
ncbi:MAG: AAA family ATPase [Phaeodactylibacter sp.]|nr:AAA family ATPase [Phaeodactylibacter sp.]